MTTVVLAEEPVIEAWLADRRAKGLDKRDEVWGGVLLAAPIEHGRNGAVAMSLVVLLSALARGAGLRAGGSFNLGEPSNFRVPDLGWHRGSPDALYIDTVDFDTVDFDTVDFDTAALVVEVLSPRDESYRTFDFYARHGVEEFWIVDPVEHSVRMWSLLDGACEEQTASALLGLSVVDVVAGVDWP